LLPLLSGVASSGCIITIGSDDEAETTSETSESSSSTDDDVGATTTDSDSSSSTESSTSESSTSESGTGETTSGETSTSSESDSASETGTSSESDTTSETGGGIEEPPPGYCGMAAGPDEPWASIDQYGQVLMPNDALEIECGGQGSWMFRIDFTVGGFQPDGKVVAIDASMDVEGFNIGPMGHFAAIWTEATWFLGCCEDVIDYNDPYYGFCYYDQYITFYPPDAIDDMAVLDGLPATINLTVETPEGLIEEHLDVTLWAVYEQSWESCLYEYYAPLPELPLDVPVPIPTP
jgi:hypothetical protein